MGFLEIGGLGANVYRNVSIVRNPLSSGLLSLNADGFHSDEVAVGPTLVDSELSFTGDDFLNIHNRMKIVCTSLDEGRSVVIIDPGQSFHFLLPGDALRFFELMPGVPHSANPYVGTGVVRASRRLNPASDRDAALVTECRLSGHTMEGPPYNVSFINTILQEIASSSIYVVNLTTPISVAKFSLVNHDRMSGAGFAVLRNYMHDSAGSGGRVIGKSMNGTIAGNVFARFGGVHVYSEQEWLEGALGIHNVHLENNTIVDARGVPDPTHVDVMSGLSNITCVDTSFVVDGIMENRLVGC